MNDQFNNIQKCSSFCLRRTERRRLINFLKMCLFTKLIVATKIFKNILQQVETLGHRILTHQVLERRLAAKEIVINFFKDAVQVSNSNLVRNTNTLLTSDNAKINPDQEIRWIGKSRKREQDKFKFTY